MRKYFAAGVTAALMIPAVGSAAVLTRGMGQGCPDGEKEVSR